MKSIKCFVSKLTYKEWAEDHGKTACGDGIFIRFVVGEVTCTNCKKSLIFKRALLYWFINNESTGLHFHENIIYDRKEFNNRIRSLNVLEL